MRIDVAWVYLLRCADQSLYCGWTNDISQRLLAHNSGKGAKYTRARRPVVPVYCELFASRKEAMRREAAIKKMTRKEKEELLKQTPSYLPLLASSAQRVFYDAPAFLEGGTKAGTCFRAGTGVAFHETALVCRKLGGRIPGKTDFYTVPYTELLCETDRGILARVRRTEETSGEIVFIQGMKSEFVAEDFGQFLSNEGAAADGTSDLLIFKNREEAMHRLPLMIVNEGEE